MKKAGIIALVVGGISLALVLGLCVILGAGAFLFESSRQKTDAIVAVLQECNRAMADLQPADTPLPPGENQNMAMTAKLSTLVTHLKAINTSKCPADFQQAFARFVQAWDAIRESYAALPQTDAQAFGQALGSILSGDTTQAQAQGVAMRAQADNLRQAWSDVQSVAAKYNVESK